MALLFANNSSLSSITALPSSISGGGLNLIKEQTASSSASISFVNGVDGVVLDGTYKEYIFKFINMNPATDESQFTFQASTNGGSSYGVTLTSTNFLAWHDEADTLTSLTYRSGDDLAQSTSYQRLLHGIGNETDQSGSGMLTIYNPSSTTYVKHFISCTSNYMQADYANNYFTAGYFNTTSVLNAFDFKFNNGNIDDGIIKLYGVS
jgi:hypothetical protein